MNLDDGIFAEKISIPSDLPSKKDGLLSAISGLYTLDFSNTHGAFELAIFGPD
jgi:hypothetical protein